MQRKLEKIVDEDVVFQILLLCSKRKMPATKPTKYSQQSQRLLIHYKESRGKIQKLGVNLG